MNLQLIGRRAALVVVLLGASGAGLLVSAEHQEKSAPKDARIRVSGQVDHPLELTGDDLAGLPRQSVTARAHDGKESRYEGVAIAEILSRASVPSGKDLRGSAVSLFVVVEASDGYRAVFALPELDPAFTDRVALLADHRHGQRL